MRYRASVLVFCTAFVLFGCGSVPNQTQVTPSPAEEPPSVTRSDNVLPSVLQTEVSADGKINFEQFPLIAKNRIEEARVQVLEGKYDDALESLKISLYYDFSRIEDIAQFFKDKPFMEELRKAAWWNSAWDHRDAVASAAGQIRSINFNTITPAELERVSYSINNETPREITYQVHKDMLRLAVECLSTGKWEEAEKCIELAQAMKPDFLDETDPPLLLSINELEALIYFEAAKANLEKSDSIAAIAAALDYLNKVIEREPRDVTVFASAYIKRASIGQRFFQSIPQAAVPAVIADYTDVIKLEPDRELLAEAYLERGVVYYGIDNYNNAISDLTRVPGLTGNKELLFRVYDTLGTIYFNEAGYEQAIDCYTKAMEQDVVPKALDWVRTKLAGAYYELGKSHYEKKDYNQVIYNCNRAIELGLVDAVAYGILGDSYYKMSNYNQAIEWLNKAIELGLVDAVAYGILGHSYREKSDYDQAIKCYNKAIELGLEDVDFIARVYNNLGYAHQEKPDYDLDLAIDCYNKAIELDPEYASPYNGLGVVYYKKTDYNQAIKYYNTAIELDPENVMVYNNLGNAYQDKPDSDFNLAIEYYNKAIELDPEYANAYNGLGNVYYKKSDYNQAITYYKTAIEKDGANPLPYYNLGNLYKEIGNYTEAREYLTIYLQLEKKEAEKIAITYNARAEINEQTRDYAAAVKDFTAAAEQHPSEETLDTAYAGLKRVYQNNIDFADIIERYTGTGNSERNQGNSAFERSFVHVAVEYIEKDLFAFSEEHPPLKEIGLIMSYIQSGIDGIQKGEPDAAIEALTKAADLAEGKDNEILATVYNLRADVYLGQDRYDEAINDSARTITLGRNNMTLFMAHNNRGFARLKKKEYRGAVDDYLKAIERNPGGENIAGAYNNLAAAYSSGLDWKSALDNYDRALEYNPPPQVLVLIHYNRGITHGERGDFNEAIADHINAAKLASGNDALLVKIDNNLGIALMGNGDYKGAIESYERVLRMKNLDAETLALVRNNLGVAHKENGNLERAIENFTGVIAAQNAGSRIRASAYNNRGEVYFVKKDFDKAIADYGGAIGLKPDTGILARAHNNRAAAHIENLDPDEAIKDCTLAIDLDPGPEILAGAYYNRFRAYWRAGNREAAINDLRKPLEIIAPSNNKNVVFALTWFLTDAIYQVNPNLAPGVFDDEILEVARKNIALGVETVEELRSAGGVLNALTMSRVLYLYYAAVDFECYFKNYEKAFEYSEQLRSRGFLEQVGNNAALRFLNNTDRLKAQELFGGIDNLRYQLDLYDADIYPKDENYAEAVSQLGQAEAELAGFDARNGEFARARRTNTVKADRAKQWCGDDRVILEYVLPDKPGDRGARASLSGLSLDKDISINPYCIVISKDTITAVPLDRDYDYTLNIESIRDLVQIRDLKSQSDMEAKSNELYEKLVAPVQELIRGFTYLTIVPDGALSMLPFDILRGKDDKDIFGERYRLSLSPSVSVSEEISRQEKEAGRETSLLAFCDAWYSSRKTAAERRNDQGNRLASAQTMAGESIGYKSEPQNEAGPLHWLRRLSQEKRAAGCYYQDRISSINDLYWTTIEAESLQGVFKQNRILRGEEVSEKAVKTMSAENKLKEFSYIHFACHGIFDNDIPAMSSILFSEVSNLELHPPSDEDGFLTLPEIMMLNMDAEMVVLSACETGVNAMRPGDGMTGLSRSFMTAGAKKVGASLWKINEKTTAEFMESLYQKIMKNMDFREAFYEVKKEFRENLDISVRHPSYWAAFVLYE
jgi:tetratricopeptide (TPR) repeat protein/CHAT domain-containing protein